MASLFSKLNALLRSPQGRRITEQVKHIARDPHKRQQAQEMLRRFKKKR